MSVYFATPADCEAATDREASTTSPGQHFAKCARLTKLGERQKQCFECGRYKFQSERCQLFVAAKDKRGRRTV